MYYETYGYIVVSEEGTQASLLGIATLFYTF